MYKPMRTVKREVTDPGAIREILNENVIIRIGLYDPDTGFPYIVPLDYGYDYSPEENRLTFYMHSAREGRKLDILRVNDKAGFEIDRYWGIHQTEYACRWGMNFDSIIGEGILSEIPDTGDEKKGALDIIMRTHGRTEGLDYEPAAYSRTTILKLEVTRFSVKRYRDRTLAPHD